MFNEEQDDYLGDLAASDFWEMAGASTEQNKWLNGIVIWLVVTGTMEF